MTKFKKGVTINKVMPSKTKVEYEFEWMPPLEEDEQTNELARKFIKENGEEIERIMGRKISSKDD